MGDGYLSCDCDKYNPECRCHPKDRPMTTDLREAVARAILAAESVGASWDALREVSKQTYMLDADAALAVAEPIIRAQVIEELCADLDSEFGPFVHLHSDFDERGDLICRKSFTDWLNERRSDRP